MDPIFRFSQPDGDHFISLDKVVRVAPPQEGRTVTPHSRVGRDDPNICRFEFGVEFDNGKTFVIRGPATPRDINGSVISEDGSKVHRSPGAQKALTDCLALQDSFVRTWQDFLRRKYGR